MLNAGGKHTVARLVCGVAPRPRGLRAAALLSAAVIALLASSVSAQETVSVTVRPPLGSDRSVAVPHAPAAPVIDGALDDAAWSAAARTADFWISLEDRAPTEPTEVFVMADATHLFFGFRVYDSTPDDISALQTRRDAGLGLDDRVTVELDPFRSFDAEATWTFSVNARGTQDAEVGNGRARQTAWRGAWSAATVRTDYGWSTEIAIPFAILNFEPGADTFSANFFRYHNRTRELSQWADTTPQNLPEQIGRMTGLAPPAAIGRRQWTFLPYVFAGMNVPDENGEVNDRADAGFDARYEPRPNLTGLISVNPDFSQIESAVTDIDFSYNEKRLGDYRPFFQEGSRYFGGNESYYFYSNRIPDFDLGTRAFGRVGDTDFGAFATGDADDRLDYFGQFGHQIDETHEWGGVVVGSDQPDFSNTLAALRGSGRETSGLNYALEAAFTRTNGADGNGRYLSGEVGWAEDHWSASVTFDEYARDFFPANGIVDGDLLDTRGATAAAGYYRDFGAGPLYNIQGSLYWQRRDISAGDLQKDYIGASGSIELRNEVRLSLGYAGGDYRPVVGGPGEWSTTLNKDSYWTAGIEFNTRNDRLSYGVFVSDGRIAEGDYNYVSGYLQSRPTDTTYLSLSAEQLDYFGRFDQVVATAGWDVTPRHNVSARLISAYYGDAVRAAWTWRVRENLDLFTVYDQFDDEDAAVSLKLVLTLGVGDLVSRAGIFGPLLNSSAR